MTGGTASLGARSVLLLQSCTWARRALPRAAPFATVPAKPGKKAGRYHAIEALLRPVAVASAEAAPAPEEAKPSGGGGAFRALGLDDRVLVRGAPRRMHECMWCRRRRRGAPPLAPGHHLLWRAG